MNVADPGVIELIPGRGERLLTRFVGIAGIPVMHQSPVWNRLEESHRFRRRRGIAVVLVLDQQRYVLLSRYFDRFVQLFHDTTEYCRRLGYSPEGEDPDPLRAQRVSGVRGALQIVDLAGEFELRRIDIGRALSQRNSSRQRNLENSGIENRQFYARIAQPPLHVFQLGWGGVG